MLKKAHLLIVDRLYLIMNSSTMPLIWADQSDRPLCLSMNEVCRHQALWTVRAQLEMQAAVGWKGETKVVNIPMEE